MTCREPPVDDAVFTRLDIAPEQRQTQARDLP